MRVPRRPRGPRTDRARAGRRVHTRPAPSAEPWLLWAVSPLGAHGPLLLSHWLGFFTPQAGRRKGEKVRREQSGLSDSRFPAAARLCPDALLTSPPNTLGRKAAAVCSLPSGDRGFTSGPGAWPRETQDALPREGPASVFSDCKGATPPLQSGGHGLSPAQQRASSPANVSVPPGR